MRENGLFWLFLAHLAMLWAFFCLYAEGLLLSMLRGPYVVNHVQDNHPTNYINSLSLSLSLQVEMSPHSLSNGVVQEA